MIRFIPILILMLSASPLFARRVPICVESVVESNDAAARQNREAIVALPQTLIDEVLKGHAEYYDYVSGGQSTDCTHLVFDFEKEKDLMWNVRAKIRRHNEQNGKIFMNGCHIDFKPEDREKSPSVENANVPFTKEAWALAVKGWVEPCFDRAIKDDFAKFHQIALLATEVRDQCHEDGQTPECLVLPLPFKDPYSQLSKSVFRIMFKNKDGIEDEIQGQAQGRCAKYADESNPIETAIAVEVEGEHDIEKARTADWKTSRVALLQRDWDPAQECSMWRNPAAQRIPSH